LPHTAPGVVVVVVVTTMVDVVVDPGGAVVVVLPGAGQPSGPHASQQLGRSLTHALPPCGALHAPALRFTVQRVFPLANVRQQATKPSLPHAERAPQRKTSSRQLSRRLPSCAAARTTRATHAT
jgi:hypothetical protein